jgi:hypothetical protein
VLRAAAEVLDPAPVAEARAFPLATLRQEAEAPAVPLVPDAPVVLAMPAAAQVTAPTVIEAAEKAEAGNPREAALLAANLATYGTLRATARGLGMAESTLRSRCKRLGVAVPGRKGKR